MAQAQWDAQFSQDQLSVLTTFARDGQSPPSAAYRKALVAFDQAIQTLTHDIDQLPQGKERQHLEHQRLEQTVQAQKAFYNLLGRLTMGDRQQTTVILGHLGAQVPHLTRVRIAFPPKGMPPGKAELTITLTGDHFQPGAQLLINNRVMSIPGTLRRGVYVFALIWNGPQVQSVGLLSRDGTVVQTTSLEENQHGSSTTSQDNRNHNNGQEDGNSNNTSGGNKNTEKGNAENNGNGNGRGKPSVTPTPPIHH
ncbi:hypothetical protein [Ktedonospora formicarum]|uniref:Uncharacterized protein n=1 Tax=Ktedonospora formicarum TaxID=2778364 RepID=A0A8J3I4P2_9CHLR|nr:hypothetical protein [Ktedonospora formicarum]GHO45873.1 hypothetical protein KSX_40360 [Ktedonospora formicarum]